MGILVIAGAIVLAWTAIWLTYRGLSQVSARHRPRRFRAWSELHIQPGYLSLETRILNGFFYAIGRRHRRVLRWWFTAGSIFGAFGSVAAVLVLLWDVFGSFLQLPLGSSPGAHTQPKIITPVVPGVNLPWHQVGYLLAATALSVAFHEAGHAIAAASEGVRTERTAVFVAVFLPGALVVLDGDAMETLPPGRALRVYCAGVWHNVAMCVACRVLLLALPLLLLPLYSSGHGLLVTGIPASSPLAGHIHPGDIVTAVNDQPIRDARDWVALLSYLSRWSSLIGSETANLRLDSKHPGQNPNPNLEASDWSSGQGWCVPIERTDNSHKDPYSTPFDQPGDSDKAKMSLKSQHRGQHGNWQGGSEVLDLRHEEIQVSEQEEKVEGGGGESEKMNLHELEKTMFDPKVLERQISRSVREKVCPNGFLCFTELRPFPYQILPVSRNKNSEPSKIFSVPKYGKLELVERGPVPGNGNLKRSATEQDSRAQRSSLEGERQNGLLTNPVLQNGKSSGAHATESEGEMSSENPKVDTPSRRQLSDSKRTSCIRAREAVELPKCGWGWSAYAGEAYLPQEDKNLACDEDHLCMTHVLPFGSYLLKLTFTPRHGGKKTSRAPAFPEKTNIPTHEDKRGGGDHKPGRQLLSLSVGRKNRWPGLSVSGLPAGKQEISNSVHGWQLLSLVGTGVNGTSPTFTTRNSKLFNDDSSLVDTSFQNLENAVPITDENPANPSKRHLSSTLSKTSFTTVQNYHPPSPTTDKPSFFLVFGGPAGALAAAAELSEYVPRGMMSSGRAPLPLHPPLWAPRVLERMLVYTFHVSAALALLNLTPVFYLDGEAVASACLALIGPRWSPRRFRFVHRSIMIFGTCLLLVAMLQGIGSLGT